MEQPKPPQPEKKLLTEIAHLTNLLHGSKLKASIRSQHHHQQSTSNLHHHHNILLRKTNPTYVGKRMIYRAHQPYFVRLNRASDGSNRKTNLALSKRFKTLRTTSTLDFKSGKQFQTSSTTSRIKYIHNNNNNKIRNRICNTSFCKINRNPVRKIPNSIQKKYLTLKTKIALTKLKFQNSTGTRFPSYFSPLQPPIQFPNKSSAVVVVPAAAATNNSNNSQILSLHKNIPIKEYQKKIKGNQNISKFSIITTSKTTTNTIPTASSTSLKTIDNSQLINTTSLKKNPDPSPSLTKHPSKQITTTIKEKGHQKEKEPEKPNRYYEMQPESSPIQAIIQRRCLPDSVSIYRPTTNSSSTNDTMTGSNDFNVQKLQSKKTNSLSPSSSSNQDDDDDNDEEEVEEEEKEGDNDEEDSQMISSCQENNKKKKNTKLAMDIHYNVHGDIMNNKKCNNNEIGDGNSTKKSTSSQSSHVSTKDGFTCKEESCNCDSCNGNLDQDIQIFKIVDTIVDSNNHKSETILSTNTLSSSCDNIMHRLAENSKGGKLKEQIKTEFGQKHQEKDDHLQAATTTSKTVEDPRRNRLLSKLSKLSSYKERHLNEGKSQMPSYFPC